MNEAPVLFWVGLLPGELPILLIEIDVSPKSVREALDIKLACAISVYLERFVGPESNTRIL